MKRKYVLLFLFALACIAVNSCKKAEKASIATLFPGGTWKLTSVETKKYIGNQGISDTTINDTCSQYFTFKSDKTCAYTNFNCASQETATGTWSLSQNQLYLYADITLKDTSGNVRPFLNSQIQSLGQYSMVLNTGDIAPNYSLTQPRTIVVYGFVRQISAASE
ncbi:MAG TPA: lipocalin family protein [Mucilaginibacter sp.]|nr:lipocalin family protein [Mucilaginibacter sp.]